MTKENYGEPLNKNRKSKHTERVPRGGSLFWSFLPGCMLYILIVMGRMAFRVNRFLYDRRGGKLPPQMKSRSLYSAVGSDAFLIVCPTSLTLFLLQIRSGFLGSGTQQAPAQHVNQELRSHGVLQTGLVAQDGVFWLGTWQSGGEWTHKSICTVALHLMVAAAFYWIMICVFRKSLTCHVNTMCTCSPIRDFVQRKRVSSNHHHYQEQHWVLDQHRLKYALIFDFL